MCFTHRMAGPSVSTKAKDKLNLSFENINIIGGKIQDINLIYYLRETHRFWPLFGWPMSQSIHW